MMEAAVVSGASGFVGRVLCRALAERGAAVTGIARAVRSPVGFPGEWISSDLAAATPDLPGDSTVFFHLAGKAHAISERRADDIEYARENTGGTRHVLDAAARAGVHTFVYFSSVKVFGDAQQRSDRALKEDDAPEPDSPYGLSKLDAERLVLADTRIAHRVVIRPSLVYGPGVKGNLVRMRDAIKRGRFPSIRESGNRRSLVHVEDLVSLALLASADPCASGHIFHAVDGEDYSTRRLYLALCEACRREPAKCTVPDFVLRAAAIAGDAAGAILRRRAPFDSAALGRLRESAWFSASRAREELGWKPLNTFESWCRSEVAE